MFKKSVLHSYLKNPFVYTLIEKVINYNFNNSVKTTEFMLLLNEHLACEECSLDSIQKFLKKNKKNDRPKIIGSK